MKPDKRVSTTCARCGRDRVVSQGGYAPPMSPFCLTCRGVGRFGTPIGEISVPRSDPE